MNETTPVAKHPKAVEAARIKQEAAVLNAKLMEVRDAAIASGNIRFVHIPPSPGRHGMTLCWILDRRNIIAVSSAICHPNDNYSKKLGEAYAALAMKEGYAMALHVPSEYKGNVRRFLQYTFGAY